jgi:hypothetical protein
MIPEVKCVAASFKAYPAANPATPRLAMSGLVSNPIVPSNVIPRTEYHPRLTDLAIN